MAQIFQTAGAILRVECLSKSGTTPAFRKQGSLTTFCGAPWGSLLHAAEGRAADLEIE
jgi:hypothetical protein